MDTDTLVVLFGLFGFVMQSFWAHTLYKTNAEINKKVETLETIVQELGDGDNDRDDRIERIHEKLDIILDSVETDSDDDETRSQMSAPSVPERMKRVKLKKCSETISPIGSAEIEDCTLLIEGSDDEEGSEEEPSERSDEEQSGEEINDEST